MLLRLAIVGLIVSTSLVLGDKALKSEAKLSSSPPAIKKTAAETKAADKRADVVIEKSSSPVYSAPVISPEYEAGTPVTGGNLYYYYYPVAAYPIDADPAHDKVGSSSSSGSSDLFSSPLVYIFVPLLFLLMAVPLISLFGIGSTGRSFGRASPLDEKFGSFAELQAEVDHQLAKYMTALDSEDCMDRIVCELGVKASDIPSKGLFFSVVEWLAPDHGLLGYGRMSILKQAADGKFDMDSCKRYTCNPPASIQEQPKF